MDISKIRKVISMEYPYDIQDLSNGCGISKASVYAFIKKNRDFFEDNSIRVRENSTSTKPKVKYNQVAMDFLLSHYGKKNSIDAQAREGLSPNFPMEEREGLSNLRENAPKNASGKEPDQLSIEALQAQISALEAKIEALEKALAEKEEERKQLLNQNGALILTIQQQQTERMMLLPAPKKSIGERIKGFFSKS